ncbi:MAG TPA: 2,3-oxidosqualene cyclase [Pseudolabrys sp.]
MSRSLRQLPLLPGHKVLRDSMNTWRASDQPERSPLATNESTARDCLGRGLAHLRSLQRADGSFEGEVVWCPMILAQYVMLRSLLQRPIAESERGRMILHFKRTQRPDGGWGLHAESSAYVFVTALSYVALRLLGVAADESMVAGARAWLHAQPNGVLSIPSWGKFWLSMAGLYDYAGMNPCPPELFMLPARAPAHPDHLYCHTRYIYLAISCLYGMRFRRDLGPITGALRRELYSEPYETINFAAHRHDTAPSDLYVAPSKLLRAAWDAMRIYERLVLRLAPLKALRRRAIAHASERIRFELEASNFQGLSPVNGMLNAAVLAANNPDDPLLAQSVAGLESWRWDDAVDGIRFAGARSTSWDTAFAMLAVLDGPACDQALVGHAYAFLDKAQELGELRDGAREGRDSIRGGWCFSDGRHRWPVSDCAAEALSAILAAHSASTPTALQRIATERLDATVQFILARQNSDGGFGSYERRRGSAFLERLNPSEMFGDCMTELSYTECTASAVMALCRYRAHHPDRERASVSEAIAVGCALLRTRQRNDGAWAGFWGINFTYATYFAVAALRAAGAAPNDPALALAAEWLVSKQKTDGGWGEHYTGCLNGSYVEHSQSQAVMTSWALLTLLDTVGAHAPAVRRGVAWLCEAQEPDGSWPQGAVNGVFFGSAMLSYRLYPVYFPLWALNRYCALVSDVDDS